MTAYVVLYTVTIALDVEAESVVGALDVALGDEATGRLVESEWGRDDITRVEVLAIDGEYLPVGHGRRLAINR